MPKVVPEELPFDEGDLAPVEAVLAELAEAGHGWVNFSPEVEPGHEPAPRRIVVAAFSSRGEPVPLATWTAPDGPGRRVTVGIEHGSGPRAIPRLEAHDLGLADGWLKLSDHARRGVVVSVPGTAPAADVLWWLLTASHALSTVPLTGHWLATIHRP